VSKNSKDFGLRADQIKPLATNRGGCIATDMITVDGCKVGYMYMDDPRNHGVYDVNTIANYDSDIILLLDAPIGSAFERAGGTGRFAPVEDE